jgi:glycerol-3-phosphate dehydrogenase (NAD(P)+)
VSAEIGPEPPLPAAARPAVRTRAQVALPGARRAVVVGAGSFGTAIAVMLARAAVRTTLQTRTEAQAAVLAERRVNDKYLPEVELPSNLRIETVATGVARADYVFLAVPSTSMGEAVEALTGAGLGRRTAVVSLSKGLVMPDGAAPTSLLRARFGAERVACVGGPSHAQEMVHAGAGLVAAAFEESLAESLAAIFTRSGLVCELSNDPIGVELAGVAKNAAALAAGATEAQGLNAAGAAAGHIFAEVWRFAESHGARPESFIGLAGAGDLVATALAPMSRNRRAGELLAKGVPPAEIHTRVVQAVEALESVPLLARAIGNAGLEAPVTGGLSRLIAGALPLADWVALVRTTVPPRARWQRSRSTWSRLLELLRRLRGGRAVSDARQAS